MLANSLAIFTVALVLAGLGLFRFADRIPERVIDASSRTDAIVVLTGGSGRLTEGLRLLEANLAERLFVSGVYQGVDVQRLFALVKRDPAGMEERIGIGTAINTRENALETAAWINGLDYRSFRLVTSAYHMPRSLMELRALLPDAVIIPHPVFPDHVKQDEWWAWPGTFALMVTEYTKTVAAWTRQRFEWLMARIRPAKGGEDSGVRIGS